MKFAARDALRALDPDDAEFFRLGGPIERNYAQVFRKPLSWGDVRCLYCGRAKDRGDGERRVLTCPGCGAPYED